MKVNANFGGWETYSFTKAFRPINSSVEMVFIYGFYAFNY